MTTDLTPDEMLSQMRLMSHIREDGVVIEVGNDLSVEVWDEYQGWGRLENFVDLKNIWKTNKAIQYEADPDTGGLIYARIVEPGQMGSDGLFQFLTLVVTAPIYSMRLKRDLVPGETIFSLDYDCGRGPFILMTNQYEVFAEGYDIAYGWVKEYNRVLTPKHLCHLLEVICNGIECNKVAD